MNTKSMFFRTTMPKSRPADYYLSYSNGMVYIDFENYKNDYIRLIRISFDGHGCCEVAEAIPMDEVDSRTFKETMNAQSPDQSKLAKLVKKTILNNRKFIWEDALDKYGL